MKKTALIYALWEKNLAVLQQYLQGRTRVVIVPRNLATPRLTQVVEAAGSELVVLPTDGSALRGDAAYGVLEQLKTPANIGLGNDSDSARVLVTLARHVGAELPVVQGWLDVLESLQANREIELTVLNEDVLRDGKMLALWSRKNGIPVLHVAHGTGMGRNYSNETTISDHVAVASRRSAEYFEDMGVPRGNIHVVGNPAWDILPIMASNREALRAELARMNDLPTSSYWLVWGSSWNGWLSALDDRENATQMHQACACLAELTSMDIADVHLIYKDRVTDEQPIEQARAQLLKIAAEYGIEHRVRYAVTNGMHWAAGSDVVVSYDSNLGIEALLCGVPTISVTTPFGAITGGAFAADDGALVAEAHEVASLVARLRCDASFRAVCVAAGDARRNYYNDDANSAQGTARLAELMGVCARPTAGTPPVWQQFLDRQADAASRADDADGRCDSAAILTINPALILDVGCGTGATTTHVKQRFPGSRAWGIEADRTAAILAQQKLERVLVGTLDEFDLEQEGIAKGTIDAVLLGDALFRMPNPWDALVGLRSYLSPNGQVVLDIPNTRNLMMFDRLANGNWAYAASGLLNVAHLRCFTLKEVHKVCQETGYRVMRTQHVLDPRLQGLWTQHESNAGPVDISYERIALRTVTRDERLEWCTGRFHLLLERDPRWN